MTRLLFVIILAVHGVASAQSAEFVKSNLKTILSIDFATRDRSVVVEAIRRFVGHKTPISETIDNNATDTELFELRKALIEKAYSHDVTLDEMTKGRENPVCTLLEMDLEFVFDGVAKFDYHADLIGGSLTGIPVLHFLARTYGKNILDLKCEGKDIGQLVSDYVQNAEPEYINLRTKVSNILNTFISEDPMSIETIPVAAPTSEPKENCLTGNENLNMADISTDAVVGYYILKGSRKPDLKAAARQIVDTVSRMEKFENTLYLRVEPDATMCAHLTKVKSNPNQDLLKSQLEKVFENY